jgi:hypothetical protein
MMSSENPEQCRAALLLVDVINDMDFPGSETLVRQAVRMAKRLAALKKRTTDEQQTG